MGCGSSKPKPEPKKRMTRADVDRMYDPERWRKVTAPKPPYNEKDFVPRKPRSRDSIWPRVSNPRHGRSVNDKSPNHDQCWK
ncbi:Ff.00g041940.m01.CDS01 [Fusarium sp. VM40]|nr:Ff.00g041940.m01.CDS01 [Fusarium sp. VM40]